MRYASVLVDVPVRSIDAPFTYAVPDELAGDVAIGAAVAVEFGSRPVLGYVVGEEREPPPGEVKPVLQVVAPPGFDGASVTMAMWIAEEYCAPPVEALRLFMPPGGGPRLLRSPGGKGFTVRGPATSPVDVRWVEAVEGAGFVPRSGARLQRAILDAVSAGPVSVPELRAQLGSVDAAVKRLAGAGAVTVQERRRFRSAGSLGRATPSHARLSAGQSMALEAIENATPGDEIVLEGVTGSGKTEVYLRAIERVLSSGQAAIVLVPEISLTPQTVGRFRGRFAEKVAVLHSRLSDGERLDEWDRVASGEARVVVGARSALFAPAADLGLIVIDEEHSSSYKQSQSPRYDARDVARRIAAERGCVLVCGSATPSLEARHRASRRLATHVVMPERVGGGTFPEIDVVDMAREFAQGHRSMFSRPLVAALSHAAEQGTRAILLLNRRGFASFLLCRECGYVPLCDACSIAMTYHGSPRGVLACHHCDARREVPAVCPECESPYLRLFGAGTQRVEQELSDLLSGVHVVRMDADTTRGKGGHERVLAEFESTPGAVLVGTQMVAKGLDYADVTVVGVLNADTTLHLPDFRSGERTYQMLAQVSGRAGRGEDPGRVIIQTYRPDHPAVRAAATHEPGQFYASETEQRRALGYPPFGRLGRVIASGRDAEAVVAVCDAVAEALRAAAPRIAGVVLGPSPAPLARLKDRHRRHVLVKAPGTEGFSAVICAAVRSVRVPDGVSVAVDIDPADVM